MHRLDFRLDITVGEVDLENVGMEIISLVEEAFEVAADYKKFS